MDQVMYVVVLADRTQRIGDWAGPPVVVRHGGSYQDPYWAAVEVDARILLDEPDACRWEVWMRLPDGREVPAPPEEVPMEVADEDVAECLIRLGVSPERAHTLVE